MLPTAYYSVAYNKQGAAGVPAAEIQLPLMQQVNLVLPSLPALPIDPAIVAQATAVKGAVFLDYEGLSVADAPAVVEAKLQSLAKAFAACKTQNNRLGWFMLGGFDFWSAYTSPTLNGLAMEMNRRGIFASLDVLCIAAYSWHSSGTPLAPAIPMSPGADGFSAWMKQLDCGLKLAALAGKPCCIFLSPRSFGGGSTAEGQPVVPAWWDEMCRITMSKIALGDAESACCWDGTRYAQPWDPAMAPYYERFHNTFNFVG